MIAQVGTIVVGFADNIMVGHYSTQSLAASSFVINIFNIVVLCCLGFSYGLTPIIGTLFAQKRNNEIGLTLRAGLIANVVVGGVLSLVMGMLYFYIDMMGQPDELLPLIKPYYLIFLASLIPLSVFNVFAQWSYAIKNTAMPMWILLSCNIINIAGNYMLIYGNWGAPELGLTGAGLSTLFVRALASLIIMAIFFLKKSNAEFRSGFTDRSRGVTNNLMGKVVRTSWPVSLQMGCETAAFSTCAVFAGWIGTVALAAFQIIIVVSSLGFCIYYSIGTAIAVFVANEAGHSSLPSCRRVAFDGYAVMLVFAAISTCIFIFLSRPLMGLFTTDTEVLTAAQALVFPLVLYQLGDATQITFANALRGTSHVMPMLWIAFFSYVVVGLSSTWLLAFPMGLGNYGIVLSFSVSLFMAATLFLRSFLQVTRVARA
ncbi:MAG: MATE family efflux transporter [Muribaculaceae bacterium]|nr:MATE family efflux transporter [Muribaculaceae bacterium]